MKITIERPAIVKIGIIVGALALITLLTITVIAAKGAVQSYYAADQNLSVMYSILLLVAANEDRKMFNELWVLIKELRKLNDQKTS